MPEEAQGVEKAEEKTTVEEQDLASKADESQETPSPEGDENLDETSEDTDVSEDLPEGDEKTKKAFITMRKRIKELEAKTKEEEKQSSVLEDIRAAYPGGYKAPQAGISETTPLDEVSARLQQAERAAMQAQLETRRLKEQQEDQEAFNKFPELKTDKRFKKLVEDRYIRERFEAMQLGKAHKPVAKVAEEIKKELEEGSKEVKSKAAEEVAKNLSAKERASLEATGSSVNVSRKSAKIAELKDKVRRGERDALTELAKYKLGFKDSE